MFWAYRGEVPLLAQILTCAVIWYLAVIGATPPVARFKRRGDDNER